MNWTGETHNGYYRTWAASRAASYFPGDVSASFIFDINSWRWEIKSDKCPLLKMTDPVTPVHIQKKKP